MAKHVLFVQGGGEGVHDRWDNRLVASLERELGEGYAVHYPRMPAEEDPNYAAWKAVLVEQFDSLGDGAILVGHSIGGAILINVLAEKPPMSRPGGIFLVAAPYVGEGGWPSDDIEDGKNLSERLPPGVPIHLYHGADDDTVPSAHVHLYAKAIPHAAVRTLEGRDHQLNDDMSEVARNIRSLG